MGVELGVGRTTDSQQPGAQCSVAMAAPVSAAPPAALQRRSTSATRTWAGRRRAPGRGDGILRAGLVVERELLRTAGEVEVRGADRIGSKTPSGMRQQLRSVRSRARVQYTGALPACAPARVKDGRVRLSSDPVLPIWQAGRRDASQFAAGLCMACRGLPSGGGWSRFKCSAQPTSPAPNCSRLPVHNSTTGVAGTNNAWRQTAKLGQLASPWPESGALDSNRDPRHMSALRPHS
eukprot:362822-Chlamydomonas_euryale.AAC.7